MSKHITSSRFFCYSQSIRANINYKKTVLYTKGGGVQTFRSNQDSFVSFYSVKLYNIYFIINL